MPPSTTHLVIHQGEKKNINTYTANFISSIDHVLVAIRIAFPLSSCSGACKNGLVARIVASSANLSGGYCCDQAGEEELEHDGRRHFCFRFVLFRCFFLGERREVGLDRGGLSLCDGVGSTYR